jgi:hypothetical protein
LRWGVFVTDHFPLLHATSAFAVAFAQLAPFLRLIPCQCSCESEYSFELRRCGGVRPLFSSPFGIAGWCCIHLPITWLNGRCGFARACSRLIALVLHVLLLIAKVRLFGLQAGAARALLPVCLAPFATLTLLFCLFQFASALCGFCLAVFAEMEALRVGFQARFVGLEPHSVAMELDPDCLLPLCCWQRRLEWSSEYLF